MDYTEIRDLALATGDHQDTQTLANFDGFLRLVESRVNKKLKTQKMGSKSSLVIVQDQRVYDLPSDFAGLRDIKVVDGDRERTMQLVTPEYMATVADNPPNSLPDPIFGSGYYAIIADKLEIYPSQNPTGTIDLLYYKKVPPLTSVDPNNWLSDENPECYNFGALVEISAFNKDGEATAAWDSRFKESMLDIHVDDQRTRWSGTAMSMRIV